MKASEVVLVLAVIAAIAGVSAWGNSLADDAISETGQPPLRCSCYCEDNTAVLVVESMEDNDVAE